VSGAPAWAWADAPGTAADDGAAPSIRILRPDDPLRGRRWADVLRWYAASDGGLPAPPAAGADDWVLALGPAAAPAAGDLARRLGRRTGCVPGAAEFAAWHARTSPRSVLLVADRARLGFTTLEAVQARTEPAGTLLGVLTGVDAAALSFAAAKLLLARPDRGRPRATALDAEHGRVWVDGREEPLTADAVHAVAASEHRSLALMAHGEGIHLFLDAAVLCGRVGREERFRGAPVPDGCREGRCKRAETRGLPAVHAAELRAERIAFLSCNSFSVAGEMYPSDSSLVLAACDGYPMSVVANPWATEFSRGEMLLATEVLDSGIPIGEAIGYLNRVAAAGDRWGTFLLFGDPLALPAGAAGGTADAWGGGRLVRAAAPGGEAGVYDVHAGGAPVREVFIGRESVIARGPGLDVDDRTAETREADAWLRRLAGRLRGAADLEYGVMRSGQADNAAEQAILARLRQTRLRVEHAASACGARMRAARAARRWDPGLPRLVEQLAEHVSTWDALFAHLAAEHLVGGGVVGDRILGALTDSLDVEAERRGGPCERCGAAVMERTLAPLDGARRHTLRECPLCGPLAFHPADGPSIALGVPGPVCRGRDAILPLACAGFGADGEDGWMLLEARDKTRSEASARRQESAVLADGVTPVPVPIKADAGFDQHSIRVVFVGGMEVLYARRVFVLTPDPAVH
jgi:hypothetical protein